MKWCSVYKEKQSFLFHPFQLIIFHSLTKAEPYYFSPTVSRSAGSCPRTGRHRQDFCRGVLHGPVSEPPDWHTALSRAYHQQPLQRAGCPEEKLGRHGRAFGSPVLRSPQCLRPTGSSLGKCCAKEKKKENK